MKFSTVAIAVLLGRPTGIFAMDTEPTSNQLTFSFNPVVSFSIRRFNDERVQAFRLVYREPNAELTYAFRSDGRLTSFRITLDAVFGGVNEELLDERFRVNYNAQTGDILGFIPTEIGTPTPQDPPSPFACDECEMVKNDVCEFIDNFCNEPLGPDLLTNNSLSVALPLVLCQLIGNIICPQASTEEVCSETCVIMPVP